MTATVNEFLAGYGVSGALQHKEQTIQDVIDGLPQSQRDAMDTVIGAAVDDVSLAGNPEIVGEFMKLPDSALFYTALVVGFLLEKGDDKAEHSLLNQADSFLEHFGVKGMKWGVIRDRSGGGTRLSQTSKNTAANRQIARGKVKSGTANLEQAHLAALKSKGHRLLNAVSGDKTFWTRMAVTAGITTGLVGASLLVPALAPASWMAAIGVKAAATEGAAVVAGHVMLEGGSIISTTALGQGTFAAAGLTVSAVTAAVGTAGNVVGNTVRAVTGNTRINNSYARLGSAVKRRQTAGSNRVNKVLSKQGSVNKKDLRHDGMSFGEILHALEAGSSVKRDAPKGDGKGGGRKFDESKVKRDGSGQFARAASAKRPVDDTRTPEQIDSDWKKNIGRDEKLMAAVWGKSQGNMTAKTNAKIAEIKKTTGIDLAKDYVTGPKTPAMTKAQNQLVTYVASEVNKILSKSPAAVSPSGTSRVSVVVENSGTRAVTFKYVFVKNKLKHGDISSTSFEQGEDFGGVGAILHALEAGSSVKRDAPKGDGKGGGRKFDESKVKRDGSGQFARQASAKRPADDVRTPEQIDAGWKKNIKYNKEINGALKKAGVIKRSIDFAKQIEKKYPIAKTYKGPMKSAPPEMVKAVNEVTRYMVAETNKVLSKSPAAISPSGTQRLTYVVTNAGTGLVGLRPTYVDIKLKHDGMSANAFIHALSETSTSEGDDLDFYELLAYLTRLNDED